MQASLDMSRLSMALDDVPLTPIGMRKNKKEASQLIGSNCSNEGSRKRLLNRKHISASEKQKPQMLLQTTDQNSTKETSRHCSTIPESKENLFSDVEDGSFVEFSEPSVRKENSDALYFTCCSVNETQYSTSSKKTTADYGFRQYVEAMRKPPSGELTLSDISHPSTSLRSDASNNAKEIGNFITPDYNRDTTVINLNETPECIVLSDSDLSDQNSNQIKQKSIAPSDRFAMSQVSRAKTDSLISEDLSIINTYHPKQTHTNPVMKWLNENPFPSQVTNGIEARVNVDEATKTNIYVSESESDGSVLLPKSRRPTVISESESDSIVNNISPGRDDMCEDLNNPPNKTISTDSLPDLESFLKLSDSESFKKSLEVDSSNSKSNDNSRYHIIPVSPNLPSLDDSSDSNHSVYGVRKNNKLGLYRDAVVQSSDTSDDEVPIFSHTKSQRRKSFKIRRSKSLSNCESQPVSIKSKVTSISSDSSDEETPKWFSTKKKGRIKTKITKNNANIITLSDEDVPNWLSTKKKERVKATNQNNVHMTPSSDEEVPKWFSTRNTERITTKITQIKESCLTPFVKAQPTSKTFLASLSHTEVLSHAHREAIPFIKKFRQNKDVLISKLYILFNTRIFNNKLPKNMNVQWNPRLTRTAGYCINKLDKSEESGRSSRIELSPKVIDSADRLRDTLVHEMCHAATWIISAVRSGHGPVWKGWANQATLLFPELPNISRCHSYSITCKYIYRCQKCHYEIGRHSKSFNTERKVCGKCYGKFELVNTTNKAPNHNDNSREPSTPRTPAPFALFVKANYSSVKKANNQAKHAEVMKALSLEFAQLKTKT